MDKVFLIADDFTGALDAGVQLAKRGAATNVLLEASGDWGAAYADYDALVLDARSRHLPPEEARDAVYQAVHGARAGGAALIYKKTDSVLRGNVGAELEGALEASGADALWFAPAYPAMARVTRRGVHYIDGVPVDKSPFGRDPFTPVEDADVRALLRRQTAAEISLNDATGRGICVFDAQSEAGLARIALRARERGIFVLAGCAGFAAHIPLGETTPARPQTACGKTRLHVVCGSVNPISLAQVERARKSGFACARPGDAAPEACDCVRLGPEVFQAQKSAEVAALLGQEAAARLAQDDALLMIVGGDTLRATLHAAGAQAVEPLGEPFPGVVYARAHTARGMREFLTKSGGFGDETLLLDIKDWMKQGGEGHAGI